MTTNELRLPRFLENPYAEFVEDSMAGHLSYEVIESYVEGRIGSAGREAVEAHTAVCAECARDVRELDGFANAMQTRPAPQREGRWRKYLSWAAPYGWAGAAAAAVLVCGLLFPSQRDGMLELARHVLTSGRQETLIDGARRITIKPGRKIPSLENYPEPYRTYVRDALRGRTFARNGTAADAAAAKAALPDSHLAAGVAYARAGMTEQALREFEALTAENPGSKIAARLIRELEAGNKPAASPSTPDREQK